MSLLPPGWREVRVHCHTVGFARERCECDIVGLSANPVVKDFMDLIDKKIAAITLLHPVFFVLLTVGLEYVLD